MEEAILTYGGAVYLGIEKDKGGWMGKLAGELTICGEGSLKLTQQGVSFKRWLPHRDFFIDLNQIQKVELSGYHLLKPVFPGKVLRIFYKDKEKDSILIFGLWMGAKDGMKWKGKIEELLNGHKKNVKEVCLG